MSPTLMLALLLVFCAGTRIRGCFRRWRQPVLRGPEWFFNVPVQPGFYNGPGRTLLQRYRIWMLLPVLVEAVVAAALIASGHLLDISWLIVAISIAIQINHLFNVERAEREARKFAGPEAERPVSAVMLSLTPRRLSDYTNKLTEGFIAVVSVASFAWLLRYYMRSPAAISLRVFFGLPALVLYHQLGFLFVKYGLVMWRTPIPQAQAEEHLQAREQARKLHLKVCDWCRILITTELALLAAILTSSPGLRTEVITLYWVTLFAAVLVFTFLHERGRLAVIKATLRARPMRLPELVNSEQSGRLLCYQPASPMLVIRGAHGYSLNLANRLAQFGAAYLAGLIALFALLQMGH